MSAALSVVVVALAGAGCGGSEDADFIEGYNTAVAPLSTLVAEPATGAAGDPAAASGSLVKLADGLDDVRQKLGALEPPADAADELDRMLGAIDKGSAQVRAMAGAASDGDVARLAKATARFSRTGGDLVAIEADLRAAVNG